MKNKSIILGGIFTLFLTILVLFIGFVDNTYGLPEQKYQIYLDGEKIGVIDEEEALYEIINKEQTSIKEQYQVDQVYPPKGFEIVPLTTYENISMDASEIYNRIKEEKEFTIKGYTATIKSNEEGKAPLVINVLDEKVFMDAINTLIAAFVNMDTYKAYIENNQVEITDTGEIIESINFTEKITIKESYIGTNEKIYTDTEELSQFFLFGDNFEKKDYVVKKGDNIESISENNHLNPQEFLIANPKYSGVNNLLAIGEVVNIALINPQLTLTVNMRVVEDTEIQYEKKTVYDDSKSPSYRATTQKGVNGITRITKLATYVNGAENQGSEIINKQVLRDVTNEIITRGRSYTSSGQYVDNGQQWGWITNIPYVMTSPYEWRWGRMHSGIDISGTGFGSPIYAAADGVVIRAFNGCPSSGRGYGDSCGGGLGNSVRINHNNGYYTTYGHLTQNVPVREGQTVKRGQIIGYMGNSGSSTGTHLHFAASNAESSGYFDPLRLYR